MATVCVPNCTGTAFPPGMAMAGGEPASSGASLLGCETVATTNSWVLSRSQLHPGCCFQIKVSKATRQVTQELNLSLSQRPALPTGAWIVMEQHLQGSKSLVFNRIRSHTPPLGATQHDFSCLSSHLHCWLWDHPFQELH